MPFNHDGLNIERISIDIDPDTLEYRLDIQGCNLSHLRAVINDIKNKLDTGNLGPGLELTDEETGRELTEDERAQHFRTDNDSDPDNIVSLKDYKGKN